MTACAHENATIARAAIVDDHAGNRLMRTTCPDCGEFVETTPRVFRGHVLDTGWRLASEVYSMPESAMIEQ